jgi:hypothetical protein
MPPTFSKVQSPPSKLPAVPTTAILTKDLVESFNNTALLVRDGPFAETKDEVAGYDIVECADFTEAFEIASKHAAAEFRMIGIGPDWQT